MRSATIITRHATPADVEIIAQVVAMAIGDELALHSYCGDDYMVVLAAIARGDDAQYSWRNAIVAEVEGDIAGAVVGYDGARLYELREGTFAILRQMVGRVPNIVDETQSGEYYLDSIGVLPKFRGCGVGRALVEALCTKAFAEGHSRVGLIVDYDNPNAEKLYTSLGFKRIGTKPFFTHQMWHLQRTR